MPRKKRDDYEQRIQDTSTALVRLRRPGLVIAHLQDKFAINARTGWKYIAEVRRRWREEENDAAPGAQLARRDGLRATLNEALAHAWQRQKVVKDAQGNPVINPSTGKVATIASPDLAAIGALVKQLRDLDAVDERRAPQPLPIIPMVSASGGTMDGLSSADLVTYLQTGRLPASLAAKNSTDDAEDA
jgi:hypothetical protein